MIRPPVERLVVADDERVLLDAAQRARHDAAELRVGLAAEAVRPDHHQVVLAAGRADELARLVLVLGHDPAVGAELHVAAGLVAAVVALGAVRVEADQAGQPAFAAVHLADDLLVVDPLEQLAREVDAGRLAAVADLVEEAVGDQLQALLDQLVVDLALALDLLRRLELRRQPGLELSEAHVVEPGRVDVVGRDPALVERASSIARSTAQSECCELSTGTKTSLYMAPREKKMGSLSRRPVCFLPPGGSTGRFRPMPTRERAAFLLRDQASYCAAMGSPLYAHLLERAADDAEAGGPVFALVEPFDASNLRADALALRLMAAVHRLVLIGRGRAARPPLRHGRRPRGRGRRVGRVSRAGGREEGPSPAARRAAVPDERGGPLRGARVRVPRLAERYRLPLRLLEVGSSAGLNLRLDAFATAAAA